MTNIMQFLIHGFIIGALIGLWGALVLLIMCRLLDRWRGWRGAMLRRRAALASKTFTPG